MHSFWIFIISLLFLWNPGCSSDKDNSQKTKALTSIEDTTQVNSDTIPTPPPPPPGLPPGQAKIEGKVIEFQKNKENSSSQTITIKVNRVLGYGSSTPPIAVTDSLEVESNKLDDKELEIGKIVSAVISYQLMLGDSGEPHRWTLVKLEKD
jgi:hypothetical protein